MRTRSIVLALFALSMAPVSAAPAATGMTTITVTGQGVASRAPDFATVNASIMTTDNDSSTATSDNNARFEALKAAIAPMGEIETNYYNINYNPPPENASRPIGYNPRYGYTVSRQLQIKINNVASTGAAVDAIVHAGGTSIGNVSYGVTDQRGLYALAMKDAMRDARSQADALAAAAGVRIVHLRSVQSGYNGGPIRYMGVPAPMMAPASAGVPTNLQPTDVRVNATITAVYDVAP